jgi:hypothetical protein
MPEFYILTSQSRIRYQFQPDEIPRPPSAIHTDEDFWQNRVPPIPLTLTWPNPWIFEQGESATLFGHYDDFWVSGVAPVFAYSLPQLFNANDELHFVPMTFSVDEIFWVNPVAPIAVYPVPKVFTDDEVTQVVPLCFDADFWQNAVAPIPSYIPPLVFIADDLITIPLPVRDEDFWSNPVAPVQATNYVRLPYVPDPEEIPAGSLIAYIPFGAQGVGSIQAVFGSGTVTASKPIGGGKIGGIMGEGKINQT